MKCRFRRMSLKFRSSDLASASRLVYFGGALRTDPWFLPRHERGRCVPDCQLGYAKPAIQLDRRERKTVYGVDVSADRNFFAINPNFLCAINDLSRKRPLCSKPHEYDAGLLMRKIVFEMVLYSASCAHA